MCEQFTLGTTEQNVMKFDTNVINYSITPVQARTNFVYYFLSVFIFLENNKRWGRSYRDGCPEEILKNIKKRKN